MLPIIVVAFFSTTIQSQTLLNNVEFILDAAGKHYYGASNPNTSVPNWTINNGTAWYQSPLNSWVAGFYPGIFWHLYNYTQDDVFQSKALSTQNALIGSMSITHDRGFVVVTSYGNALDMTPQVNDLTQMSYIQFFNGSKVLSGRYNAIVGCIRSWDPYPEDPSSYFRVIMDNMMNLELLFKTHLLTGIIKFYDIAINHAYKTQKNHFRPDNSTYHQVIYNSTTGYVIKKVTHQGYADNSTWARGQAWAIYGFTMAFRYTKEVSFKNTAIGAANYYISRVPQNVYVPKWDFDAPENPLNVSSQDSSAAVIVASALQELATYLAPADPTRLKFSNFANQTYSYLYTNQKDYLNVNGTFASFLKHGTGNRPKNISDTGLIYGDYYLLEGLNRYRRLNTLPSV